MREEFPLHDNEASSFFSNMTREMKKLLCETVVEKKKNFASIENAVLPIAGA